MRGNRLAVVLVTALSLIALMTPPDESNSNHAAVIQPPVKALPDFEPATKENIAKWNKTAEEAELNRPKTISEQYDLQAVDQEPKPLSEFEFLKLQLDLTRGKVTEQDSKIKHLEELIEQLTQQSDEQSQEQTKYADTQVSLPMPLRAIVRGDCSSGAYAARSYDNEGYGAQQGRGNPLKLLAKIRPRNWRR